MKDPQHTDEHPARKIVALLAEVERLEQTQTTAIVEQSLLARARTETTSNLAAYSLKTAENAEKQTGLALERTALTREQTRLSTRSSELANIRTELAQERTAQAEERSRLAARRTEMAFRRTALADFRSKLAEQRTQLAQNRTTLSHTRTDLAEQRNRLAEQRTALSHERSTLADLRTNLARERTVSATTRTTAISPAHRTRKRANRAGPDSHGIGFSDTWRDIVSLFRLFAVDSLRWRPGRVQRGVDLLRHQKLSPFYLLREEVGGAALRRPRPDQLAPWRQVCDVIRPVHQRGATTNIY